MINYSKNKTDCTICPYLCSICENNERIYNYLDIYKAKCYQCKKNVNIIYNNTVYSPRYDSV